jgi:hypothetical protein
MPVTPPTMAAAPPAGPPPAGPPTTFAAGPPSGGAGDKSKRSLILGLVALLLVAAVVGSFLVLGGGDDDGGGDEIVLEPIGFTLEDDFAGNLDLDTPGDSLAIALPDVPPLGEGIGSALAGLTVDGDEPGLFGGSQDVAVCDVEQLVDFLTDEDNADKAEAWAEVHDIDVDEIEDFIAGLTPVRLRFDTRVTNHGFRSGNANPLQSILEKGTAVLVDDEGVPRVKCNCGNPLLEPAEVGDLDDDDALDLDALAQNPEDAWDDFDPDDVVTINGGDTINVFVLVDIDTGDLFTRAKGSNGDDDAVVDPGDLGDLCELLGDSPTCSGAPPDTTDTSDTTDTTDPDETTTSEVVVGTGDVQVTVQWDSNADIDLAVTDPTGDRISFSNSGPTASGGQLDVDSNVGCTGTGSIENIFWPPGQAPAGTYTVEVDGFATDSCGESGDYTLTIRVAGQDDQVIEDSVGEDETDTFTFEV